ncbi:MAG: PspA/IM30 family protein [Acidobacteria bacterium]|nr:PspA/IM30 family protein [Acidobacteriota bacterium]
MKIAQRITMIFRSKANATIDRYEDPQQTMDYSYQKQLAALHDVRRGIADVATSRQRLEIQANELFGAMEKLHSQAATALSLNREDLARAALTRRAALGEQLAEIKTARDGLYDQETRLTVGLGQLQTRVESFRTRAETIKASYSAAEAQSRIGESLSGLSSEMTAVNDAMTRAEDHARTMTARSAALDELLSTGVLADPGKPYRDPITHQLDQLSAENQVEEELAKLRAARAVDDGSGN